MGGHMGITETCSVQRAKMVCVSRCVCVWFDDGDGVRRGPWAVVGRIIF
jgi:hypothetical protein